MCYLKKNRKTLMIYKNNNPNKHFYGFWDALGGKIESGESPKEAVIREFKEESGLALKDPKLRGVMTFRNLFGKDWLVYVFTATDFDGNLVEENDEGSVRWIDDDKFFSLKLCEADLIFVPLFEKDEFFTAEFMHDKNNKLVNHKVEIY
ncbi:MAG: 8-oxo-dGTP diphosphatase [Candidatus Woesearchaeota archaeon]|nr:8-oxo-dGTP diphosphatase [Candidatus Woesearchaeota archaeon]